MGEFLSEHFEREGFIAFAAPEKRGKSFWLLETVFQALRQRRKVLYYILGDMSEDQANTRLYSRLTRRPSRSGEIRIPTSIKVNKEKTEAFVERKFEQREQPTGREIWEAFEKLRRATAMKVLPIKTRCASASAISASQVKQDVKEYCQSGWVPDVVVLDYADLLAPESSTRQQDFRHQVNESWKILRGISLDYHCLVVTATQAAATSYDAKTIRKRDFSEDKRKAAHVTGMLGINQTGVEKEKGIYRLNWIVLRDGKWADHQVVWTVGNLGIACPCIKSTF